MNSRAGIWIDRQSAILPKLAGGMAMAQQPDTAEYEQMPTSAIATGQIGVGKTW